MIHAALQSLSYVTVLPVFAIIALAFWVKA